MVFLWFSYGFPMVSLWFPYIPIKKPMKPPFPLWFLQLRRGTVLALQLRFLLWTREGGVRQQHPEAHGEAGHQGDDAEAERLALMFFLGQRLGPER